jgi:hypothetical protein
MAEDHLVKASDIEQGNGGEKLARLKRKLCAEHTVNFYSSPEELAGLALNSLSQAKKSVAAAEHVRTHVHKKMIKKSKPTVFISYPTEASVYATCIKDYLKNFAELTDFRDPTSTDVMQQIVSKISDCDLFFTLWHTASPWIPFELGVAINAGKPCFAAKYSGLISDDWKRLLPGYAIATYTDLNNFEHKILPIIYAWINDSLPRIRS